jgi:hypothetical protein
MFQLFQVDHPNPRVRLVALAALAALVVLAALAGIGDPTILGEPAGGPDASPGPPAARSGP